MFGCTSDYPEGEYRATIGCTSELACAVATGNAFIPDGGDGHCAWGGDRGIRPRIVRRRGLWCADADGRTGGHCGLWRPQAERIEGDSGYDRRGPDRWPLPGSGRRGP
jgi:hypothetical protein